MRSLKRLSGGQLKYGFFAGWLIVLVVFYRSIRELALYQINDDFFLYGILSSTLYGFSSKDLIFISAPLNYLLKFAFEANSNINWYFEFYLTNMFLVLILIAFDIYKKNIPTTFKKGLFFLLTNLFLILFILKMFYLIQYSQVAIISAGVGFVIFLKNKNMILRLFAILLILLGFSWRSEAAILAIGLVLLVYFGYLTLNQNFNELKKKSFILVLLFMGFIFTVKSINFLGFAPWQTSEQNEFKKLRINVIRTYDFAPNSEVRNLQKTTALGIGWSSNDYLLFGKTYFADTDIYSNENLDKLAREASPRYDLKFFTKSAIELFQILKDSHIFFLMGIPLFLTTFFYYTKYSIFKSTFFLSTIFIVFIFLVYLLGKMPDRIFWPVTFLFFTSILLLFKFEVRENSRGLKNLITLVPILVLTATISFLQVRDIVELQWWKSVKQESVKGFDRVLQFESGKPIVAFSSFYSPLIQSLDPSSNEVDQIFKDMIYLNWATRSTDYSQYLDNLEIERNLFSSIASGKAYLATAEIEELQMVSQYLIEHHGIEPVWDDAPFIFSDTGLGIWKIIEIN